MLVIETVFVFLVITASCESLPVEEADRKKDSNEKTDNSQDWQSSYNTGFNYKNHNFRR